jgi:hypothetical protein
MKSRYILKLEREKEGLCTCDICISHAEEIEEAKYEIQKAKHLEHFNEKIEAE